MLFASATQLQLWWHFTCTSVYYLSYLGRTGNRWVLSGLLIDEPRMSTNHASLLFPWQRFLLLFYKTCWLASLSSFFSACLLQRLESRDCPLPRAKTVSDSQDFELFKKNTVHLELCSCPSDNVSLLSQACCSSYRDHQKRNPWCGLRGQIYREKVSHLSFVVL